MSKYLHNLQATRSLTDAFLKGCFVFFCWLFIGMGSVVAQDATAQMDTANEMYKQAKYQEAAVIYEELVKEGFTNTTLHYNLGSTYYRLQRTAPAILHFEKALRHSPNDRIIKENLETARKLIKNEENTFPTLFYIQWWRNIYNLLSSSIWGILTLLAFWGFCFLLYRFLTSTQNAHIRRTFFSMLGVGLLSLLLLILAFNKYSAENDDSQAIIFKEELTLRKGPSTSSDEVIRLSEGIKVEIVNESAEWVKVSLPDDTEGWVKTEDIRRI